MFHKRKRVPTACQVVSVSCCAFNPEKTKRKNNKKKSVSNNRRHTFYAFAGRAVPSNNRRHTCNAFAGRAVLNWTNSRPLFICSCMLLYEETDNNTRHEYHALVQRVKFQIEQTLLFLFCPVCCHMTRQNVG